jgi:hypothetical protein
MDVLKARKLIFDGTEEDALVGIRFVRTSLSK